MEENPDVFDRASALSSLGDDPEFLRDMAGLVQCAWPALLDSIQVNLAAANFAALEAGARIAKAAAEYLSAKRVHMAALQLQMMAGRSDGDGAKQVAANLEGEVAKLQSALAILLDVAAHGPCEAAAAERPFLPGDRLAGESAGETHSRQTIRTSNSAPRTDDPALVNHCPRHALSAQRTLRLIVKAPLRRILRTATQWRRHHVDATPCQTP